MLVLRGLWRRLPLLIRVALIALIVTALGELPWSLFVNLNIRMSPSFPWATMLMATWLIAYCWYFSGHGRPRATQGCRRTGFRRTTLPAYVWLWSTAAGAFAITSLIVFQFVLLRLVHVPARPQPALPIIPLHTLLPLSVMSAFASAIPEEVGFRGYLQSTLEQRFSPISAILLTSIAFMLAHLNHGLSLALVFDFAYGAVFAVLAYRCASILPAIALHSSFDVIQFVAGRRLASLARSLPLIWVSGMDRWFLAECSACALLAAGAFLAFRNLPKASVSAPRAALDG